MNPRRCRTALRIAADHPCLPGHFPGHPVVPGVVLLDHVAALAGREFGARLAALPQVKFLAPLLPGETAELLLEEVAPQRLRFRITRGDDAIASGEVRLA